MRGEDRMSEVERKRSNAGRKPALGSEHRALLRAITQSSLARRWMRSRANCNVGRA